MSSSKKPKTQIADYYMSIHAGICSGPVDALTGIYIGEKTAWEGDTGSTTFGIHLPELFGGYKKEGGLAGTVTFANGESTQVTPEHLAQRLGRTTATCPGFRGLAALWFYGGAGWFSGFKWGSNSPYLRTIWARVRRSPKGLTPQWATIPYVDGSGKTWHNANPACAIFECLTNNDWGMGSPTTALDMASFERVAETLYHEQFGLSLAWVQQTAIEDFVKEIQDHIQATLFVNPRTGLLTIKLIRDDYDPNTLPIFTPDNATLSNFQRKAWAETTNEIIASWTNPANEEEETVLIQDLANMQMQGRIVSDNRNYYGVRNRELAARLAARDLRIAAAPLTSCTLETNRSGWAVLPGECIKVTWPEYGFENMVMRVGTVDYGRVGDSKVRVSLTEDVFSLGITEYDVPPGTSWQDPSEDPVPMAHTLVTAAPAYVVANMPDFDEATLPYPETLALVLAAQTGSDTISFVLQGERTTSTGAVGYETIAEMHMTTRAELALAIPREATSVIPVFQNTNGPPPGVGHLVLIGAGTEAQVEWALIQSIASNGAFTLARGILDTVPMEWPAGTPVWFLNAESDAIDPTEYAGGQTIKYKLLPRTSKGVLDAAAAPVVAHAIPARPHLPNRPANVKVNGSLFGPVEVATGATQVSVTWSNRDRTMEDSQIRLWTDGNVAPETGQSTKITVMDLTRTVLATHSGLSGTSFNIPITSFADVSRAIVRVGSERDGLQSLQALEITVNLAERSGYGFDWGENYGGGN